MTFGSSSGAIRDFRLQSGTVSPFNRVTTFGSDRNCGSNSQSLPAFGRHSS